MLSLVALGASNKAIARELKIEMRTVKSHMTSIMSKLSATSRTQAAGIAAARGLVELRALRRSATDWQAGTPSASRVLHRFSRGTGSTTRTIAMS